VTRPLAIAIGVGLAILALGVYLATRTDRFYDHFVWQAAAFLEGQAAIRYPVGSGPDGYGNWYFQDVLPVAPVDGVPRGLIPFPPLPAVLLVPFVALYGIRTDDQTIFTALAAIDVAICWWMIGRLRVGLLARFATTVFFAFGTVFWYSAQNATTWYQAHIVAVGLTMLAVGLAIGADPDDDSVDSPAATVPAERPADPDPPRRRLAPDPRAFAIGILFGLACTARLTVILAAPFFALVGPGGTWRRRSWSVGLGAAIPVGLLLAYNVVTAGHVFHPAYDHLYQLEARAYIGLGYHLDWAAEDPRYIPQNLGIMLLATPDIAPERLRDTLGTMDRPLCTEPGSTRGLFDVACPLVVPRDFGMSVLLTSPAFLLAAAAFRADRRRRILLGATLAIVLVSIANLMHFSQGWVQFGYRFSNDVVPFALLLVALGIDHLATADATSGVARGRWACSALPLAMALIVASMAINLWGVIWSRLLGW
jgi:4-amino-4-deoxy-L-arabinose transferase-like glycosyltransferase